jgi:putative iron-dependent peroxidase
MALPQSGIFALGTLAHTYLELDLREGADAGALAAAVAQLCASRTTMGGVNQVAGFHPALWRRVSPSTPPDLSGFDEPVTGSDGFTMPATQHDVVLWVAGGSYDVVFDAVLVALALLDPHATLATETPGWIYHHDLDLTGFIDGTENPTLSVAPTQVLVPEGLPGAAGSVLLLQKWGHDSAAWTALGTTGQEQVMGRTKAGSVELEDKPETSHVARTDQDTHGHILRRNVAYGTVSDHGTMFVGFAASRRPLASMLDSMAGVDGPRDALTRYATPLTGAYYFVPSTDDLVSLAPDPVDD